MVRGPGTSTSDSIPARLSDGEFVLPADTVKHVGVRTLRDLVAATHEPTGNPPRKNHLADGDMPEEEKRKNSFGDAAAMAQDASVAPVQARVPATPSAAVSQIPTGDYPKAPAPDGSQNSVANTEIGRNVSNSLMALPGAGGIGAIAKTGGAISTGINAASRLLNAGANTVAGGAAFSEATQSPGGSAPSARVAAPVVDVLPNPTDQRLAEGTQRTPLAPVAATAPEPAAEQANAITFDPKTNTYSGTNIGPGATILNDREKGNFILAHGVDSGAASAQRVADIYKSAAANLAGQEGVATPVVRHAGNDWQARNDLRSAAISASSMTNARDRNPRTGMSPAEIQLAALAGADAKARELDARMPGDAMKANAELQRAGMHEQGANARNALDNRTRSLSDLTKLDIDRGRFDVEKQTAAVQNRTAQRIEKAQTDVENARTPEEQRSARQRLLALMGKSSEDSWKPVALQGGTDAQGNKTESILGAVNERTGEMRRMNQAAPPAAAPADGTRVRGKDGRLYVVKNGQPVPMGG